MTAIDLVALAGLSSADLNRLPVVYEALVWTLIESDTRGCGCVTKAFSDTYSRTDNPPAQPDVFGRLPVDVLDREVQAFRRTVAALAGVLAQLDPASRDRAVSRYLTQSGDTDVVGR